MRKGYVEVSLQDLNDMIKRLEHIEERLGRLSQSIHSPIGQEERK